jgi:hypothetical protein
LRAGRSSNPPPNMRRFFLLTVLAVLALPADAPAQQPWKPLGKTEREGTALFVRTSSIKRGGDTVTALILTRLAVPQYVPERKDSVRAITLVATFNCKLNKVAIKESIKYFNFDQKRVAARSVPKIPGYGAVFGAAMPIVRDSLCLARKK